MPTSRQLAKVVPAAIGSLSLLGVASAQTQTPTGRAGQIDTYGAVGWIGGDSGDLTNHNIHFDLDSAFVWGFGMAYHFTDQWSALFDVDFAYTTMALSLKGGGSSQSFRQNADYFNGRLNAEWTPRPAPISPVVSAGIGWNNFRTAVPGASPQVYCGPSYITLYWWCATGVPTYDQTAFSWNVGAGVRWDATTALFLKLMYQSTWASFSGVSGTRQFNQVTVQIGGKYH